MGICMLMKASPSPQDVQLQGLITNGPVNNVRRVNEIHIYIGCHLFWCGKIAVLVTSLDEPAYPAIGMPKHYRDRADAENCFDELTNP